MAANKIILKIEEEGIREAAEIVDTAKKKAAASTEKITAAAKVKIEEINAQAAADADEAARRQILIAELEARKNSLDSKRKVLEAAFAKAEETGKGIILAAMVETYAVLSLLISFIMVNGVKL